MANDEHVALLKQGVAAWNKWREEITPNILPDFEADFSSLGPHLGSDLSEAFIRGYVREKYFKEKEANLLGADLSGMDLSGANLSGADLRRANLSGARNLRKADLSEAKLSEANLSGMDLSGANLGGADLRGANLSGARNLSKADLSRANLGGADLRGMGLSGANLGGADLRGARLNGANLREADLGGANLRVAILIMADLSQANLSGARLGQANLSNADLRVANLIGARLNGANLREANLREANLSNADLSGADLGGADLSGANLGGANLSKADLLGVRLGEANLSNADLQAAALVDTDLTGADLTGCRIYGVSAWGLKLERTKQQNLVITRVGEPEITVDNIEVAQFIYLLLNNQKIRDVIDTVGKKGVLLLGRFTDERKAVLDALREELRKRNYLPILFDFSVPATRDITETVSLLARMARFIIADLTDPSSIPKELEAIVPHLAVPVQPLLEGSSRPYAMFKDYWKYDWVLPVYRYEGPEPLLATLAENVIAPAEGKVKALQERRRVIEAELTKLR